MNSRCVSPQVKSSEQSDGMAVLEITAATQAMSSSPLLERVSMEPSFPDDGKVSDVYLSSGSWMCRTLMHVLIT